MVLLLTGCGSAFRADDVTVRNQLCGCNVRKYRTTLADVTDGRPLRGLSEVVPVSLTRLTSLSIEETWQFINSATRGWAVTTLNIKMALSRCSDVNRGMFSLRNLADTILSHLYVAFIYQISARFYLLA